MVLPQVYQFSLKIFKKTGGYYYEEMGLPRLRLRP